MSELFHTIYAIENRISGRVYVGRTYYAGKDRFKAHYLNPKTELGREMRALGKHNFKIKVLAEVPKRDAGGMERLFIHLLEANDPQFGYNSPKVYPVPQ